MSTGQGQVPSATKTHQSTVNSAKRRRCIRAVPDRRGAAFAPTGLARTARSVQRTRSRAAHTPGCSPIATDTKED